MEIIGRLKAKENDPSHQPGGADFERQSKFIEKLDSGIRQTRRHPDEKPPKPWANPPTSKVVESPSE
jgi:hypothetical protein